MVYTGSAIEFESDNLLQKAGGSVAANAAENKLNEQLAKWASQPDKCLLLLMQTALSPPKSVQNP